MQFFFFFFTSSMLFWPEYSKKLFFDSKNRITISYRDMQIFLSGVDFVFVLCYGCHHLVEIEWCDDAMFGCLDFCCCYILYVHLMIFSSLSFSRHFGFYFFFFFPNLLRNQQATYSDDNDDDYSFFQFVYTFSSLCLFLFEPES